jgi:hypothetical protein
MAIRLNAGGHHMKKSFFLILLTISLSFVIGALPKQAASSDQFLPIPTPYDDGTNWNGKAHQATHPSIAQFDEKWHGYKYWMAFTPYPYENDQTENPCIVASNDGINWQVPAGVSNPLVPTPKKGLHSYNSDGHLFYNPSTSRLELWYREFVKISKDASQETLYRITSSDGKDWTDPEAMTVSSGDKLQLISPSIIFEDGIYKMWVMRDWYVLYSESTDGKNWGPFNKITANGEAVHSWHPDVMKVDGVYYMLNLNRKNRADIGGELRYSTSTDGIHFTAEKHLLSNTGNKADLDGSRIYRSSMIIKPDGVQLYYGQASFDDKWTIGIASGRSLDALAEQLK